MVFREQWVLAEDITETAQAPRRVLCIAADESLADAAAEAFGESELIVVIPGDGYAQLGPRRYAARCDDGESLQQALAAAGEAHGAIDALVHAASVRAATDERQWRGLLALVQGVSGSRLDVGRVLLCACYEDAISRSHAESWIGMERSLRVLMPGLPSAVLLQRGALRDADDVHTWTRRVARELGAPTLRMA